ncbi:MAG TPA: alpha-2-macroglobulin family protein, partial [Bacteroidia bacterium]|nr:alpha-2-macroglobulin family protein [Bacteroidia bacterium]
PDTKSGGTITRESFSYMAAKNINSVVSTQAGVIMVRGSRSDSSGVFVDGERLITGGLPAEYGDVKQVRNKFSDYAYWQPNLITDKNGEAFFDVTFPDNVTNWKSYAIALDDKKHSGRGFVETKAYKNIMANLALPRFMLQGDSAMVVGKTLNYTDKAIKAKTCFKLNDKVIIQHDTSIKNSVIEKVFITSVNEDSIKVNYSVEQYNGPKDGEERSIPVMSLGIEETKGLFFVLNRDTTLTIDLDSGTTEIYIQNNPIDFMLKEIEQLKNYPYWCMEQTASKLNALLMEEKIKNQLHQDFEGKKSIKKLLGKLEKGQKQNGSWGWWEDSPDNAWMTSYITRIINEAKKMGYEYKNIEKARQYLLWNLSGLQGNELLSVLNTFSEMNVAVPYADYLKRFEKDSLSLYQKFLITKIKQENRLSYDLKLIMKTKKETILKGVYWGNDGYGWYDNSTNISLLAYKILEKSDSNNAYLPHIRNYFLEIKNQNKWRNTIETANILETILPAFLRQSDNKIKPTSVTLTGAMNENVLVFPFKKTVTETDKKLTVTKTGSSPAFFTSYQKQWNSHPKKKEDYYAIKTYYEVKGKKTDALTAGVPTDLVIEVDASKKAEYVMIEVPIPAGCSYDDNKFNTTYYEVHREYFKNKTSIFCQELTQGKHIFKIKLQPRFTGSYHLNPAKAELMYFPIFYGRNEMKKTCIR